MLNGLIWLRMGQRELARSCECGNEPESSIICEEFVEQLRNVQLLKEDSAPCSLLVEEMSKGENTVKWIKGQRIS